MHRILRCECGQKMRITPEMLGASGKCVKCGTEVVVTELNTTLVVDEGDQMPPSSSRMPPPPFPPPSSDSAPMAGMAPPPAPEFSPVRKTPAIRAKTIGVAVTLLVLFLLGYLLLGLKGDPLAPNDKNFARAIGAILAKEPELLQEQIPNDAVLDELVSMGLLLVIKKGNEVSYELGDEKQGLLIVDASSGVVSLKCATSDSDVKVVRFTLPPKGERAISCKVIYTFQWKPTALLTDAKYKPVQDALGPRVDRIREEIKKPANRSVILVRYNDGWHKADYEK